VFPHTPKVGVFPTPSRTSRRVDVSLFLRTGLEFPDEADSGPVDMRKRSTALSFFFGPFPEARFGTAATSWLPTSESRPLYQRTTAP
jgi:hypothetical protein